MADSGIKKVVIKKEDLPPIDGSNFAYNIRYRIIQDNRNLYSSWSNVYNLSAGQQKLKTVIPYTYSVDISTDNLGVTKNTVKIGWVIPTALKLQKQDVFIARDLVGKSLGTVPSGSTSYTLHEEDSEIEIGQLVIGSGFDANTTITNISGTTVTINQPTISNIANNSYHKYYGTKNVYITSIGGSDKLETGQFTFYGKNNFSAGEVVIISSATTPEFNGKFEILEKNLSSTQFTVQIFKDLTLFLLENPSFTPVSSTAVVFGFKLYETTTNPTSWIPRKNYEDNIYVRVQQNGFPKVARKNLEVFSTNAIDVT